jgi:transposase
LILCATDYFFLIIKSKIMKKEIIFEQVYESVAGIDVGSEMIYVSTDGENAVSFGTCTSDYHECVEFLQLEKVTRVAMEATGVYWIAFYSMLESAGIKVSLINPAEIKQRKGKKTDVRDCKWIHKIFSAGLVKESFIPEGKLFEIRFLVRERLDIIEMGSTYVNKMHRCLELMNIKIGHVLSQIQGTSGMKILRAIVDGERDTSKLLSLCDQRVIKQKGDAVKKSLEGNYNETWLFMLKKDIELWEQHEMQVMQLDQRIAALLNELTKDKPEPEVSSSKPKPIRHHKPQIEGLQTILVKLFGVDASTISGINNYTLLRLIGETGMDMSRFETKKHFISWCGLSPAHNQSGKTSKYIKHAKCNKAGQIFKEAAQSLDNSKFTAIGQFIRTLKVRRGAPVAYKAGARKIAAAYYDIITQGKEYVEYGVTKQQELKKEKELTLLKKLAKKHSLKIIENQQAA